MPHPPVTEDGFAAAQATTVAAPEDDQKLRKAARPSVVVNGTEPPQDHNDPRLLVRGRRRTSFEQPRTAESHESRESAASARLQRSPSIFSLDGGISRGSVTSVSLHPVRSASAGVKVRRLFQQFIESTIVTFTSVVFTLYALWGDDVRLLATDKPADIFFNVMCLVCLVFFSIEIGMKSVVEFDYFPGFFFKLDCVATATLLLDLTWVSDFVLNDEYIGSQGDTARTGRTARVGASLGRVVRVLRLVRILKLYKAYFEKGSRRLRRRVRADDSRLKRGRVLAGACLEHHLGDRWDKDDDGWLPEQEDEPDIEYESLVGKKLVSMMTRRLILLVLAMLVALPFLSVSSYEISQTSATWGADSVQEAMDGLEAGTGTRDAFASSILKYIYYHNWFDGHGDCSRGAFCSNAFYSHVFWVGFAGADEAAVRNVTAQARPRRQFLEDWERNESSFDSVYSMGTLPDEQKLVLSEEWREVCYYAGVAHRGVSMLSRKVDGYVSYTVKCPDDMRPPETSRQNSLLLTSAQLDVCHFAAFFDVRPLVKLESALGLAMTVFVCAVLAVASAIFSSDANAMVLRPIERMMAKVLLIRDNPLMAIKLANNEFEQEEINLYRKRKYLTTDLRGYDTNRRFPASVLRSWTKKVRQVAHGFVEKHVKHSDELMETHLLEKTITKLGTLLSLGFGQAGVNIVSNVLQGLDSSGLNVTGPGTLCDCIIGSVRIRDFSTTTEVLQTKIMSFVNQIAEIVHGTVDRCSGAVNKNFGASFLVVWKVAEEEHRSRVADRSLMALANMLGHVHHSYVLARYRQHPGLQQRLGSGCRVNMSFGLHEGWAIEGAVGTDFKVDASYLSPNVSIAESLQHATKIYGVWIVASEMVVGSCSRDMASRCRKVDNVMIRGSVKPLELYAFDLQTRCATVSEPSQPIAWNTRERFRARQLLDLERNQVLYDQDLLEHAEEVVAMREPFTQGFFQYFNMGYQNYVQGEWNVARTQLMRTLNMLDIPDGPSGALLAYMRTHQFEAPEWWRGVHDLQTAPLIDALAP